MLAVLALRNARLVDGVRSAQRRGLDSLTQMSRHVASSLEPATFYKKMSETVAGLVSADRAGFWQLTGTELVPLHQASAFAIEQSSSQPRGRLDSRGDDDLARVLFSGQALRLGSADAQQPARPDSILARLGARDVLAVPWRTAAVPLGILAACSSRSGFSDQDEWIMRLAARASALVWQGYAAEQRIQGLQAAELDRLEAHAQRMAEFERQKSEFLQLASHELRAPITLVIGYLSMLEEGSLGALPESVAKIVPLMTARMRHMSELVDRMLTTSRMEIRARGENARDVSIDAQARAVAASASVTGGGRAKRTIGLGLHLSRALAQAQGGDIAVTSRPGEGSTFTLRLPRGRKRPAGRINA